MEKVMTNGFCELNEMEMMEVEGGITKVGAVRVIAGVFGLGALTAAAIVTAPIGGAVYFGGAVLSALSIGLGATGELE